MTITEPAPGLNLQTTVSGEVFVDQPDAAFWVGSIATGETIRNQDCYDGLMRFRGNVYVRELNFLTEDCIDEAGREIDEDDKRAIEFVVIENSGDTEHPEAHVVGSARLIMKTPGSGELPIEHYFPEDFQDHEAEDHSVEISRFIARHPNRRTQRNIMLSLVRAITLYSAVNNIKDQYFMIEEPLVRLFNMLNVPQQLLGPVKDVPDYNGKLFPVHLDPNKLLEVIKADLAGELVLTNFFEKTASETGEGLYPASFLHEGDGYVG